MALDTFSGLKTSLANWLARSDLAAFYDDLVTLGELRLSRDLHIRAVETSFDVTMSSGVAVVPTDFCELKHSRLEVAGGRDLKTRQSNWIYERYPRRESQSRPMFIGIDGSEFVFGPFPDSDYQVKGVYYKKPVALSDGNPSNEWTASAPDALLMASLSESAPFLKEDARVVTWEGKYKSIVKGYVADYQRQIRRQTRVSYV